MKYLHLMAGLSETSGVANIARRFARVQREGERVKGEEVKGGGRNEVVLLAPAFKWNPIYFGPLFAIKAAWRALWADEVWVHCSWTFPVWYGTVLAKLFGKKLVVVPEASFDPKRINNHAGWKKRIVMPLDKWVIRQADEVLALCKDEIGWVKGFEPSAKVRFERVPTFYEGVAIRRVNADLLVEENRPLHVLFLGRADDPLKGVEFLERAVQEINDEVGVKSEEWRKVDLRIESNIFGEAKEAAWEWADMLCLPTLSDNFGLVVAESLEHGRPVITTDGASAWEPPPVAAEVKVKGQGQQWWDHLVYLRGFRDGTDAERIRLLKDALKYFIG